MNGMIYLNVPYPEKDEAKKLGARWNPELKKWYAIGRRNYAKFAKWLDGDTIVYDHLYIVEGPRTCFRCGEVIKIIGFGFDTYFHLEFGDFNTEDRCVHIGTINSQIPKLLEKQLSNRYNFKMEYSHTTQSSYYANHCQNCKVIQGNFFVFEEVDSPFFVDSEKKASELILRKIDLPCDICVSASIGYGSENHLIKKYATINDSDMQWNTERPPAGILVDPEPVQDEAAQEAEEFEKLFQEFTKAAEKAVRYENHQVNSKIQQHPISSPAPTRYARQKAYEASPSWGCTLLLAIFLGFLGVHRMYVGKVGTGILFLFTFGLLGIGWLIDIIDILDGTFRDSNGCRIRRRRKQF